MGKIGIITCGLEPNYGACLQALATQHVITEFGYESDLMDYSFMDEKSYSPFRQKSLRSFVSASLFYSLRKSLHKAFAGFRKTNMKYSSIPLHTPEDFRKVCGDYDAFLVGSDQVWNPNLGINTDITLLRFYEEGPRRISYASSFGVADIDEQLKPMYRDALGKFSSISTREVTGKQLVKSLNGKDSIVSLDPTMLLTAFEWQQYEQNSGVTEPYVLIYDMRHSPMVMETAKRLAEQKNAKVLAISRIIIQDKKIRTLRGVSPGQFLSLIKNAEAVVTDSFHGTVFSITYQKEFYSYCSRKGMKIGGRITNVLSSLGLSDRLIHDDAEPSFSSPNYKDVIMRLAQMRTVSLNYLKKALAGEKITQQDCATQFYCLSKKKTILHVGEKEKNACCGCGLCATVCPVGAIKMVANEEGFLHPIVDKTVCVRCRKCVSICPFEEKFCIENGHKPYQAYIARSLDAEILKKSASGGLFTILSDEVLAEGGNIYGAVYDEDGSVCHICAKNTDERNRMRGSKYVQSNVTHIYEKMLKDLQSGRKVLFTGTPCQNVAVKAYLAEHNADCSNLILCDIICHGVSSSVVWKNYLSYVSTKTGKIISINTRDKKYGSGYNMTICGEKGKYRKKSSDDPFIRLFQLNLPLRSSCFDCPMKRLERVSDITIGDFQKAKTYFSEYADSKGVSVALVNSEKGKEYWELVCKKLDYKQSSMEAATQVNLYTQIESDAARNRFFVEYQNEDFSHLLKKYTTLGIKNKLLYITKRTIKRIIGR